jgi:hypothetical protein
MSVILATQEVDRRVEIQSHPGQIVCKTLYLENAQHKKELVEGLK